MFDAPVRVALLVEIPQDNPLVRVNDGRRQYAVAQRRHDVLLSEAWHVSRHHSAAALNHRKDGSLARRLGLAAVTRLGSGLAPSADVCLVGLNGAAKRRLTIVGKELTNLIEH